MWGGTTRDYKQQGGGDMSDGWVAFFDVLGNLLPVWKTPVHFSIEKDVVNGGLVVVFTLISYSVLLFFIHRSHKGIILCISLLLGIFGGREVIENDNLGIVVIYVISLKVKIISGCVLGIYAARNIVILFACVLGIVMFVLVNTTLFPILETYADMIIMGIYITTGISVSYLIKQMFYSFFDSASYSFFNSSSDLQTKLLSIALIIIITMSMAYSPGDFENFSSHNLSTRMTLLLAFLNTYAFLAAFLICIIFAIINSIKR